MTEPRYSVRIQGADILCQITSDIPINAPVFCFSLMAPPSAGPGGRLIRTDGSYGEVQLPDLAAGTPHDFVLRYADAEHTPTNRAWLPLGAYLRAGEDIIALPVLPAGVANAPEPPMPKGCGFGADSETTILAACRWNAAYKPCSAAAGPVVLARGLGAALQSGAVAGAGRRAAICSAGQTPWMRRPYRLEMTPDGISITYGGAAGGHYAGISLLVLRHVHNGDLPCGVIEDAPRFAWRGQHLDCARHFFETVAITRLLDLMALLKLNRFHWHFSDDESFRLQLDSVPELTDKTAARGEGELVPGVFGGGAFAGGRYSKADARRVIGHAAELFIDVLPEIEFPAHALAVARAFPATRDPDDLGQERSVQGYAQNVL